MKEPAPGGGGRFPGSWYFNGYFDMEVDVRLGDTLAEAKERLVELAESGDIDRFVQEGTGVSDAAPPIHIQRVTFPNRAVVDIEQRDGGWFLRRETEDDPFLGEDLTEAIGNVGELGRLGELEEAAFEVMPEQGMTQQQLRSMHSLRADIAEAEINDINVMQGKMDKALELVEATERSSNKVDELLSRLQRARDQGPEEARNTIRMFFRDSMKEVDRAAKKRHLRQAKLIERAEKLDPERARQRIRELEEKILARPERLREQFQRFTPEFNDFSSGDVDFSEHAREWAENVRHRIIGDPQRAVGMDLYAEQGPELARALDIPLEEKAEFLIRDMDKVLRIYARQVIPDIELKRALGDVSGAKVLDELREEFTMRERQIAEAGPEEARAFGWSGRGDIEKWRAKRMRQHQEEYKDGANVIAGMIQRLRHRRGVPDDADSALYRMGNAALALNVTTSMGNVLMASLVDPSVAVQRYGLRTVFRHGIMPFARGMKHIRMSRREAEYAGTERSRSARAPLSVQ
jgi:hypothetical protein